MRTQAGEGGVHLLDHLLGGELRQVVLGQHLVHFHEPAGDLGAGERLVKQVGDAQAAAVDLVGIGRADAALGGADLLVAEGEFAGDVEFLVEGQHHVRPVGDEQLFGRDRDAERLVALDFRHQADGIDDDAVADDVDFAVPENAGGEQVEDVADALGDDGVAGVVAALAADDDVGAFGQVIDNLAFAFISPLETYDDGVGH